MTQMVTQQMVKVARIPLMKLPVATINTGRARDRPRPIPRMAFSARAWEKYNLILSSKIYSSKINYSVLVWSD